MKTKVCAYKLLESIKYIFDLKYSLQLHAQDNSLINYIFMIIMKIEFVMVII